MCDTLIVVDTLHTIENFTQECNSCSDCGIELVNSVDSFYQSAWNTILWFIGVLGAVGAFLIPYLLNRYNRKSLEIRKEDIIKELSEENTKLKNDIAIKTNIELDKIRAENTGSTFHMQGLIMGNQGNFLHSFLSFLAAFERYLVAGDTFNLKTAHDSICENDAYNKLNKEQVDQGIVRYGYSNIEDYIEHISIDDYFSIARIEISEVIKKLHELE